MKSSLTDKKQMMYENSDRRDRLQDIIPVVGKSTKIWAEDREITTAINQCTT